MDKVAELLEKLATKLGVTVEYLWPFLVARTKYEWLGEMLTSCVAVFLGLICLFVASKIWKNCPVRRNSYGEEFVVESEVFYVFFLPGILMGGLGLLFVFITLGSISAFLCPEGTTIIELLKLAK